MKKIIYSQVGGRRAGEEPRWELDPFKIILGVGTAVLAGWMAWVSLCSIDGTTAKEHVPILHQRITKDRVHSDAKRDEAVGKITDKMDRQYEGITQQLMQIQRDVRDE